MDPGLLEIHEDAELILEGSEVTLDLAKDLELLAPFGSQNPKPLFGLAQVEIKKVTPMGNGTHARFTAECEDGTSVECVIFGKVPDYEAELYGGMPVDLIGTVDWKEWRGRQQVQFTVDSIL
jgi:single-stranded-DNA-specific exonuclease